MIIVPFDNTALSNAGLRTALTAARSDEEIRAVAIIPENNERYARSRNWIGPDEEFDIREITATLTQAATDHGSTVTFHPIVVPRFVNTGSIARTLRDYARQAEPRMVVIGSDNAGRLVTAIGGIGKNMASATEFDVLITRSPSDSSSTAPPSEL